MPQSALSRLLAELRFAWNDHRGAIVGAGVSVAVLAAFFSGYGVAPKAERVSPKTAIAADPIQQAPVADSPIAALATPAAVPSIRPTPPAAPITSAATAQVPEVPLIPLQAPESVSSGSITIRGTLTMSSVISNDVEPTVECGVDGVRLEVKDNTGAIAALGLIETGQAREIREDEYSLGWTCTHPYSVALSPSSPVYSFRAYYENLDIIEPWSSTISVDELAAGKAPQPHLHICIGCS